MKQKKPQIYTVTMAQLLMDWRTSQGISRYEVAKSTDSPTSWGHIRTGVGYSD